MQTDEMIMVSLFAFYVSAGLLTLLFLLVEVKRGTVHRKNWQEAAASVHGGHATVALVVVLTWPLLAWRLQRDAGAAPQEDAGTPDSE